ncbi:MAG: hypothetical protein R3D59_09220 [Paracoccaceae bacterium]
MQGPDALKILEEVNEGGPLTTKFFNMGEITVAGCKARTLSHGMGGAQGLAWGPYEEGTRSTTVLEAREIRTLRAGARACSCAAESVPSPLPAIYTGEAMKAFREWLPADNFLATCSVGGSFQPENVEDYLTPGISTTAGVVKFDHAHWPRSAGGDG